MEPQAGDGAAVAEVFERVERRRAPRFDCDGVAEVYSVQLGSLYRGKIQTISRTGCYITTHAPLRVPCMSQVDLLFILNNRNYQTNARVISVHPGNGVALEFQADPKSSESLTKLMGVLSGNA